MRSHRWVLPRLPASTEYRHKHESLRIRRRDVTEDKLSRAVSASGRPDPDDAGDRKIDLCFPLRLHRRIDEPHIQRRFSTFCGQENRVGARFCRRCGGVLTRSNADPSPACGASVTPDAATCHSCGLALDFTGDEEVGDLVNVAPASEGKDESAEDRKVDVARNFIDSEGVCPACGEQFEDNANSCSSCGLVFSSFADSSTASEELLTHPGTLCPACAIPCDPGTRCCPRCGRSMIVVDG